MKDSATISASKREVMHANSNSPNPFRVYIRLCKHGKRFPLLKWNPSYIDYATALHHPTTLTPLKMFTADKHESDLASSDNIANKPLQ